MKKSIFVFIVALAATTIWAQTLTCSNGTSQRQQTVNGYDYELWSQNGAGTASLTITQTQSATNGGTFSAEWNGTINVLSRAGKRWGSNSTTTVSNVGDITIDFAATWSSGDDVKYLGVYGWGYYAQGRNPTKQENGQNNNFSNQIEYYIIQDFGSYNPTSNSNLCGNNKKGSATIDGINYDFWVCDRINQPMLTGNGNFKQYFSIPTSGKRTSGMITVSKHFAEWEKVGMSMNALYEVAMKVESYTGSASSNGRANVTKNILCIGSCSTNPPPPGSSSSVTTNPGSSSSAAVQATTCKTPLIEYPTTTVPADPYTACFKHTNNKCYVCMVSSEGEFEGNVNTCSSGWVWDGTQLENNLESGFWYQEVDCPSGSPSSSSGGGSSSSGGATPILLPQIAVENMVTQMKDGIHLQTTNNAVVEFFSLSGKKMNMQTFTKGTYSISLGNLPKGMYVVKVSFGGSERKTLRIPVL